MLEGHTVEVDLKLNGKVSCVVTCRLFGPEVDESEGHVMNH